MIVADASWIVALRDPLDAHHDVAVAISAALGKEAALLHAVTFAECLVAPAALGVIDETAAALRAAFQIVDIDRDAPLRWARLRSETGLRLPDAIVLDTAIHAEARAIATFDEKLASRATDRRIDVLRPPGQ